MFLANTAKVVTAQALEIESKFNFWILYFVGNVTLGC